MSKNLSLQSPWVTYENYVRAILDPDPDIEVGHIDESINDNGLRKLDVVVNKHEKAEALKSVLIRNISFGNVTLIINIIDTEINEDQEELVEKYKKLFVNNPIVKKIETVKDHANVDHSFICFDPVVVQFYNDDLTDLYGNYNGLFEDIARNIFNYDIATDKIYSKR